MLRLIMVALVLCVGAGTATAQTLDAIKASGKLKIGYRLDAVPFSYKTGNGEPAGYTVDLCRLIAQGIQRELKLDKLDIVYVPVSTADRFEAIRAKKIDMLCGATTETLERRKLVDFSMLTFFTGASVMILAGGPTSIAALDGKTIAVRTGTTTESGLGNLLKREGVTAKIVGAKDHSEGVAMLIGGKADAYFADRAILLWLAAQNRDKAKLVVANNIFEPEPYAIAVPYGDPAFRLAVDTQLSAIYRSQAIVEIFNKNFFGMKPSQTMLTLYLLNALPR